MLPVAFDTSFHNLPDADEAPATTPLRESLCRTSCDWLPAVPAPFRSVDDEADEPDDECNGGDPPQDVQGEPGAKQQQRNDKKRNKQSHILSLISPTAVLPDFMSYGY